MQWEFNTHGGNSELLPTAHIGANRSSEQYALLFVSHTSSSWSASVCLNLQHTTWYSIVSYSTDGSGGAVSSLSLSLAHTHTQTQVLFLMHVPYECNLKGAKSVETAKRVRTLNTSRRAFSTKGSQTHDLKNAETWARWFWKHWAPFAAWKILTFCALVLI